MQTTARSHLCTKCKLQDPNNVLVIFSGSETNKLEDIFGDLPVWLAAENGVFVRPPPQHLSSDQQYGKRVSNSYWFRAALGMAALPLSLTWQSKFHFFTQVCANPQSDGVSACMHLL